MLHAIKGRETSGVGAADSDPFSGESKLCHGELLEVGKIFDGLLLRKINQVFIRKIDRRHRVTVVAMFKRHEMRAQTLRLSVDRIHVGSASAGCFTADDIKNGRIRARRVLGIDPEALLESFCITREVIDELIEFLRIRLNALIGVALQFFLIKVFLQVRLSDRRT